MVEVEVAASARTLAGEEVTAGVDVVVRPAPRSADVAAGVLADDVCVSGAKAPGPLSGAAVLDAHTLVVGIVEIEILHARVVTLLDQGVHGVIRVGVAVVLDQIAVLVVGDGVGRVDVVLEAVAGGVRSDGDGRAVLEGHRTEIAVRVVGIALGAGEAGGGGVLLLVARGHEAGEEVVGVGGEHVVAVSAAGDADAVDVAGTVVAEGAGLPGGTDLLGRSPDHDRADRRAIGWLGGESRKRGY